jgi:hypothetical protein
MDEWKRDGATEDSLRQHLETWVIGPPSDSLEARLRRAFRAETADRRRPWHWWLRGSVSMPMPLLLGLVATCVLTTALALRCRDAPPPVSAQPPQTESRASTRSVSLVGFEPVPEPKLTVFRPGERP